MESGATKDCPAVLISLDILKESLLLHNTPEEEPGDLSNEQVIIKKRFYGLKQALGKFPGRRNYKIINTPSSSEQLQSRLSICPQLNRRGEKISTSCENQPA